MPSAFELLEETPRPFLDLIALKEKFLKLSSSVHPDRVHALGEAEKSAATQRFADLNAAYLLLRDPQRRLSLLFEIETGTKLPNIQSTPADIVELFMEVGQFFRDVDPYLSRTNNQSETSSIVRATSRIRQHEWSNQLKILQAKIETHMEHALLDLQKLDANWMTGNQHQSLTPLLEHLARVFAYLARWNQQLSERSFQLKTL